MQCICLLFHLTDRSSPLVVSTLSGKPSISGWWAPMERGRAGFGLPPSPTRATLARCGPRMGNVFSTSGTIDKARSIESCDLRGETGHDHFSSKESQRSLLHSLCWAPDGRILFSMAEQGPRSAISIFGRSRSMRQPADP